MRRHYLKTDNKELLTLPFDENLSSWDTTSREEFTIGRDKQILLNDNFTPWMESIYRYDDQKKFEKSNKEKPITATGRYGYDEFLIRYKDTIASVDYDYTPVGSGGIYNLTSEKYSEAFRLYKYQNKSNWCFILRDLNEDEIYELATGCLDDNGDFQLFDLYTLYDNTVVHLLASAPNHLINYYLDKDNRIIEYSAAGALIENNKLFKLSKRYLKLDGLLIMEDGLYYNYENFGTTYETKKRLNRYEYERIQKEQYKGEFKQDVVMLKDWYPGMRINEDPDGDANDDGEINMLDVLLVHKHILSLSDEAKLNISYVDINKDNTVNVLDLMLLKHSILMQ